MIHFDSKSDLVCIQQTILGLYLLVSLQFLLVSISSLQKYTCVISEKTGNTV